MPYLDPEKQKAYQAKHHQANKTAVLERTKKRRLAAKILLQSLKESKPCLDCKQWLPYYVMHYDHLLDKEFNISKWATNSLNVDVLMLEIGKCDLICSNCHAVRTYFRTVKQSTDIFD